MNAVRRLPPVLLFLLAASLQAQEAKRPLTLDDYGSWNRIAEVELSPDGRWMTYALRPNDGDATLFVTELDGSGTHEATNGVDPAFSADGRFVAFLTTPPEDEAAAQDDDHEPVRRTLRVIDLRTGEGTEESAVRSFAFDESGGFLAIHRDRADAKAEHEGSDLLLRDLRAGTVLSFGNVAAYAFNEAGSHLAYVIDADGMSGNGVYVVGTADGRIRPIDTGRYRYEDLAWNEAGDALVALRGTVPEGKQRRANAVLLAADADATARVSIYDPSTDASFPAGFVVSELADTRWTDDGRRVLLGVKEQADERAKSDGDVANVDVWHWADERLQSEQMVDAAADRRYTYASVLNVRDRSFHRLATDAMRRVDVTDDGRWGIGRKDDEYRGDVTIAGGIADYVRIDLETGQQREMVAGLRRPMGTSPDGAWFLFVENEQVQAMRIATLERHNLTQQTGIDFIDREFDLVTEAPAHGVAGWTDHGSVLLYDRWDVWEVPLAGGEAVAVTGGAGAAEQIQYRVVRLDPDADYVDPDGAILSGYGEWTKKSGYLRARPGKAPEPLLFGDEMIGQLVKAADADRVVFTRQTFERFPDYWVADTRLRAPRQVTHANPQVAEFAWGRRTLVDYTDERGNHLQATLTLPAGYEQGRRYPMIVYFYEKMSQRHHEFSMPVYDDRPHMSTYASNGYLVLMPDIVYDDGYPGSSALDDVTAAARRVVELGYADPDRIGLQGHSWGGYETSFILTQTDMFRTIVTGAPLTNLMSMNNILYKRTGNQNGPILQWSQGRMGDQPWDDMERWMSQSPIYHVPSIATPFLILHGTADGAVDWNQGLELYTAARRLGKEVILLSYPDEPHHLAKEANQKDFQRRMKQYFDHWLMDVPAPEWMTTGVPFLVKEDGGPSRKVVS